MSVYGCVAFEPLDKIIPGIRISVERSMLVVERFIDELSTKYGKFLKLEYHLHSTFEKGIIEKTVQYVKDRT